MSCDHVLELYRQLMSQWCMKKARLAAVFFGEFIFLGSKRVRWIIYDDFEWHPSFRSRTCHDSHVEICSLLSHMHWNSFQSVIWHRVVLIWFSWCTQMVESPLFLLSLWPCNHIVEPHCTLECVLQIIAHADLSFCMVSMNLFDARFIIWHFFDVGRRAKGFGDIIGLHKQLE